MSYSIRIPMNADSWEEVVTRLSDYALSGITEEDESAVVFFPSYSAAAEAATAFGVCEVVPTASRNWSADHQSQWRAFTIGERFFLAPHDSEEPTPAGRIRLAMEPGNVFGGGDHPTTQLCLELMEIVVGPDVRVADIGAGTGILSRAARALGAWAVAGDIDRDSAPFVDYLGSADALASTQFDVVIANIHLSVLRDLEADFRRILKPDGILVLSGFLAEQAREIEGLFGQPAVLRQSEGWCAGLYVI